MKNIVALLISALLIVTACAACSDKSKQRGDEGTISAESFGADGSDTKDDRLALQDAFNYARDFFSFRQFETGEDIWGGGVGYAYNSIVGPLKAIVHWSSVTRSLGFYASLGFDF